MNTASATYLLALVAILLGMLNCFGGYRILKVILGLAGFCAGAAAGWTLGSAWDPGSSGVALLCALLGGILGALLCVWLYFLGIFLLGAALGAVVAQALLHAASLRAEPFVLLVAALLFGLVALALQKLMLILSTAFGGAYLIVAGAFQFLAGGGNAFPAWPTQLPLGPAALSAYLPLLCWLVLGSAGVLVQYSSTRRKVAVVEERRPVEPGGAE